MILYIHSKCSTCKKALTFLKNKNLSCSVKDIVTTPPTIQELNKMLQHYNGNIKKLLNTSGMQYREMGLSERLRDMSTKEILEILSQNGMLIKRPFFLSAKAGLTGFEEKIWLEKI